METTNLKQRLAQGENTDTEFKENFDQEAIETKIIFDSPIQETIFVEIDDISEQLNGRQKNAFSYAQSRGQISKREYMEINHVSHRIAYT